MFAVDGRETKRDIYFMEEWKYLMNWIHFQKTKPMWRLRELKLATGTKTNATVFASICKVIKRREPEKTKKRTSFPACLQTLLVRLKAVGVSSAAAVPEARAAPGGGIIEPIKDKFGTGSFLFGKLADVHSCGERWKEEKHTFKKDFSRETVISALNKWAFHITKSNKCVLPERCCRVEIFINPPINIKFNKDIKYSAWGFA